MTQAKKLKKAIRSRAGRTGESYTSARRHVLAARQRRARTAASPGEAAAAATAPARSTGSAAPSRPRRTTGDASVRKQTGHGLDHWFAVLDAFGASAKGHTAAARHLYEAHGVPGWHCQMITVEYERARGLRARNQSSAGDFQVSVSRTVAATVPQVAGALNDAGRRRLWLRTADARLARALESAFTGDKPRTVAVKTPESARMRFRWDASTVEISITGKPGGKASIVAANSKLADAAEVERRRSLWSDALAGLKAYLEAWPG